MDRRTFFKAAAAGVIGAAGPWASVATQASGRKKIAALSTTYHVRSHSDNFITRFLEGYWINDKYHEPPCDVASLFVEQEHDADISARLAKTWGVRTFPTIQEALPRRRGSGRGRRLADR